MRDLLVLKDMLNSRFNFQSKDWKAFRLKLNDAELKAWNQIRKVKISFSDQTIDSSFRTDISRNVLSNLYEKLLGQIPLHTPDESISLEYTSQHNRCVKLYSILAILEGFPRDEFSKKIAYELIAISEKFRFTDFRIKAHRYLFQYYTVHFANNKEEKRHLRKISELRLIQQAEVDAEQCFNQISALHHTQIDLSSKEWKEVENRTFSLQKIADSNIESFDCYMNCYSALAMICEYREDFNKALSMAEKGYNFFTRFSNPTRAKKGFFMLKMTNALLRLGRVADARTITEKALKIPKVESEVNWLTAKWYLMQIELAQKKYAKACLHYRDMTISLESRNLLNFNAPAFETFRPYFYLLWKLGYAEKLDKQKAKRIASLDLNIPPFDLQNEHVNIPLLIAQIGHYILFSKYKSIAKVVHELNKYGKGKIRSKNKNYRSYVFIKMLNCIVTGYFNPISIQRKAKEYHHKLTVNKFIVSNESKIPEFIPYDDLWDIYLTKLIPPKRRISIR